MDHGTSRDRRKGLLAKGSFQNVHFLEALEKLENLEILETAQSAENRGESDHSLEILETSETLEILEFPPVKRPLYMLHMCTHSMMRPPSAQDALGSRPFPTF